MVMWVHLKKMDVSNFQGKFSTVDHDFKVYINVDFVFGLCVCRYILL